MEKVIQCIKENIKKNSTVVIGVSGGPDSMCLLDLINSIKNEYNLTIIVAHINHGIREESKEEAVYVKQVCEQNGCVFSYKELFFQKTNNFENRAREERYKFFTELIKKQQASYLLTAHHGDDLIETILMRIARGSNLSGYSGFQAITQKNGYVLIRPLLYVTKKEIENYNKKKSIPYYIDKTNTDEKYTRNRYRKYILPFLYQENQSMHKKFIKFSEELVLVDKYLQKQTRSALTSVFEFGKVNLHEFKKLDPLLQRRVLEDILEKEYEKDIRCVTSTHVALLLELVNVEKANAKLYLPLKRIAYKEYNFLYIKAIENNKTCNKKECRLEEYLLWDAQRTIEKIKEPTRNKSNFILRLNSKEVSLPLRVRTRKQRDKMEVKNLHAAKKLKDIFINEKIPKEKRENWPIVTDANDNILWIPGVKKSKFDKNTDEYYDIIYKYVISEEKQKNEEK